MIDTKAFGAQLRKLGYSFYSGVPCSFLKHLINYALNECDYVAAANEGDAVAIASGAYVAGKKPVVLMQNSGLSNAVSPLVSLNYTFRIPLLGFVSLRGEPGRTDEPQHELMGQITTGLLDLMQIKWMYLSFDMEEATRQLELAASWVENGQSSFFVVREGTFENEPLKQRQPVTHANRVKINKHAKDELPSRSEALKVVNGCKDDATVLLATTGKTGRELYEIEDARNHLYMVGSMGCVSSFGLGLALNKPGVDTVVIDGDGSLLMRMGSLATNGFCHPPNLLHIVLDNNAHDSTGGQRTVSHNMNFIEIAAACGYEKAVYAHSLGELGTVLTDWKRTKGLTFIYMKIAKVADGPLGRPHIKPYEVRERLQSFLAAEHP